MFLADHLHQFEGSFCHDSSLQEAMGSMYFKDRKSAERVQAWLLERVSKRHHLNSIETGSTATQMAPLMREHDGSR
jgi:hypothetical protein